MEKSRDEGEGEEGTTRCDAELHIVDAERRRLLLLDVGLDGMLGRLMAGIYSILLFMTHVHNTVLIQMELRYSLGLPRHM